MATVGHCPSRKGQLPQVESQLPGLTLTELVLAALHAESGYQPGTELIGWDLFGPVLFTFSKLATLATLPGKELVLFDTRFNWE